MSHEASLAYKESELETYCAGLSFVGSRTLTQVERTHLKRRRGRLILAAILWPVFVPLVLPLSLGIFLRVAVRSGDGLGGPFAILGILAVFVGLPVGLLKARDLARRARVLKRAVISGRVRCFAGICTDDDWTDLTLQKLKRIGLAQVGRLNQLELFPDSEVIYRLNDSEPTGWMTVELTTAAAVPVAPALFKMPTDWEGEAEKSEITRRRLTDQERGELNGYAARLRKSRWMYVVPAIFLGRLATVFTSRLANPDVRTGLGIAFGFVVFTFLFQRATRHAVRWMRDAECGWLVVIDPAESPEGEPRHSETPPPVEMLPLSGVAWTIRSKPAGWRRHYRHAGDPVRPS